MPRCEFKELHSYAKFCLRTIQSRSEVSEQRNMDNFVNELVNSFGLKILACSDPRNSVISSRLKATHNMMVYSLEQMSHSILVVSYRLVYNGLASFSSISAMKTVVVGLKKIEIITQEYLAGTPENVPSRINFPPEVRIELFALLVDESSTIATRKDICERTGLTISQVNNWIWTQRSRLKNKRQRLEYPVGDGLEQEFGHALEPPALRLEGKDDPFLPLFPTDYDGV